MEVEKQEVFEQEQEQQQQQQVPELDVNKLIEENKELRRKLELLEFVYQQMTTQQQSQQQQPSIEEDEDIKQVKENYPEIYNAMRKILEKEVMSKIAEQQQRLAYDMFKAQLTQLAPHWEQLNYDPQFNAWLDQPSEEIPSMTRRQLLNLALAQLDARGVASFFNKYMQMQQSASNMLAQKSVPVPKRANFSQSFAENPASSRIFTESEIKNFYTQKALGKISPEQAKKIEEEIIKAIRENRVLYGQ